MRLLILILSFILFTWGACNSFSKEKNNQDSENVKTASRPNLNPAWIDSGQVKMLIDSSLDHNNGGFIVDSVLLVNYKGSSGEIIYEPLDEEGKWLDSIYWVKKVSNEKISFLHNLLGHKSMTDTDLQFCCFDPQFALIFFKANHVIAKCIFSIPKLKFLSTTVLGNGKHIGSIDSSYKSILIDIIK